MLAAGVGGKVLLVGVPAEGMEQLEFDLDDDSTPGQHGRQLATAMQNCSGSMSDAGLPCVQLGAGISYSVARVLAPVGSIPPSSSTARRCAWLLAARADASVLPEWSGEAVTCLSFSPDGQLLAVGGADGTVRVWQLEVAAAADRGPSLRAVHSTAVPASAGSVGAVRWLPTDGGCVLLTGNRNNSTLQLWHSGVAGGAWVPLQRLSFEGKGGQQEFFNQLDVVPSQQLVVLADTARKAVYTLHYSGGQAGLCQAGLALRGRAIASQDTVCWHVPAYLCHLTASLPPTPARPAGAGACLRFDYAARFGVALPILSFAAHWNPVGDEQGDTPLVELTCVQTSAIQQYSLDPRLCYDDAGAAAGARSSSCCCCSRVCLPARSPQQLALKLVASACRRGCGQWVAAAAAPQGSSGGLALSCLCLRACCCLIAEEADEAGAARAEHRERLGREFDIQPQPSAAVPMPSEALANGTPKKGQQARQAQQQAQQQQQQQAEEAAPAAAATSSKAAAEAEAAAPLASIPPIPPPTAQEPQVSSPPRAACFSGGDAITALCSFAAA